MLSDEVLKKEPEGDSTPAWMLTFADLVSLLICFFVLLYSMKAVNEHVWKEITGSFAGALSYNQKFKKLNPNNDSGVEVEPLLYSDTMEYIQAILISKFQKQEMMDYIEVFKGNIRPALHLKIPSKYVFEPDSVSFTKQGREILSLISSSIMYIDGTIDVASYVKDDPDFNIEYQKSLIEALKVRNFMKEQGVKSPIKLIGYGSAKFEDMNAIYAPEVVDKSAVAIEIIIESKMF